MNLRLVAIVYILFFVILLFVAPVADAAMVGGILAGLLYGLLRR